MKNKEENINENVGEILSFSKRKKVLNIFVYLLIAFYVVYVAFVIIFQNKSSELIGYIGGIFSIFISIFSFINAILCIVFDFLSVKRSKIFLIFGIIEIIVLCLFPLIYILLGNINIEYRYLLLFMLIVAILSFFIFINVTLFQYSKNRLYKEMLHQVENSEGKAERKKVAKMVRTYIKKNDANSLIEIFKKYDQESFVNQEDKQTKSDFESLIYQHDSELLQILKDPNHCDDIQLHGENGEVNQFSQVYVCPLEGRLYCILKPINKTENIADDEAIVFRLEEDEALGTHQLKVELDEELAQKVFDLYYDTLNRSANDVQSYVADKIETNTIDPVKEKKSYLISTILMSILYAIVIAIGVLGVTKVLGNVLNSMAYKSESIEAGNALSFAIGMMFFSFVPTLGYFFAFNRLYELKKKIRIIIFLSSLFVSIGMIVVFFITYHSSGSYSIINECDKSAWEQMFTILVSHVGFLIIYLLTFLKIDYNKLNKALFKVRKKDSDEPANSNFLTVIVAYTIQFFKWIARLFILFIKWTLKLRDKSKPLYFMVFSIIFTILCYFASFISFAVIIGLIIALISLWFFGSIKLMYIPTTHYVYQIYEGGYTRTLTYDKYYNGHDRYKDDTGHYWYSDDNGSTFYRE